MAHALCSKESGFKCGKCRSIILIDNDGEMLLLDHDNVDNLETKYQQVGLNVDATLWHLQTDSLPDWVTDAFNESSWTKGKLHCPTCQTKVGSFDFIGEQSQRSPVHLVKSKVDPYGQHLISQNRIEQQTHTTSSDKASPLAIQDTKVSIEADPVTNLPSCSDLADSENTCELSGPPNATTTLTPFTLEISPSSSDVSSSSDASESESGRMASGSSGISNSSSSHQISSSSYGSEISIRDAVASYSGPVVSSSSNSSSSSNRSLADEDDDDEISVGSNEGSTMEADVVEMDFVLGNRGDMRLLSRAKKRRLKVNRKHGKQKGKHTRKPKKLEVAQLMEQRFIQEILAAEPELDALDPSLICPVCLDLLHEPFAAIPCKHIFCEPCLRRLGSKNPMNTLCPMCRQRIVYCEPKRGLSLTIREEHTSLYMKRKKFERGTPNVYSLPLPWRPGWINLVSGRAMGGNRFEGDSTRDTLRRIVQQLPYYVPPVVIANLINLVFFVFLLGAVEIAPLLLGLFMGRSPSLGSAPFSKFRSRFGEAVVPPHKPSSDAPSLVPNHYPTTQREGSAVGEEVIEDNDEGITRRPSLVEDIVTVSGGILEVLTSEGESSEMSSSIMDGADDGLSEARHVGPNLPPVYHPSPEATSPALDATFYYVLCTMVLLAAVFGNFLLFHQQPAFGIIPRGGTLIERLYNYIGFNRHIQRVSDFFLIILLSSIPILLLPLLVPFPTNGHNGIVEHSWYRSYLAAGINLMLTIVDIIQSFLTLQTVLAFGIVYWVGSVYLDYGDND